MTQNNLKDPGPSLKNNGELWIATGRNRFDKNWKNKKLEWSEIIARLTEPRRTSETYAEYMAAKKPDQDNIKDVGGFVGGTLKDGKRGSHTVTGRSILSFDLDFAPVNFYDDYTLMATYASACYSTHKHNPKKPRLRLLVPLSRTVTADEYEAVARMLATDIGMEYMDPSTFQPSRLMYWPSCSEDGAYYFNYLDAPFLDPDEILARYPDWTDASQWPVSDMEAKARRKLADKQADPTEKPGIVGAFCRTYDIVGAIEAYLSDVYTPTDHEDRYTYAAGSTAGGLVIYDGGLFAYSNHGTDPASGQLCNAFDLVRLHKFLDKDEDVAADTPVAKLPSYQAMQELAAKDEEVRALMDRERHEEVNRDFEDDPDPDAWRKSLVRSSKGVLEKSVLNCSRIFENAPELQGLALNELSGLIHVKDDLPVPWDRTAEAWTDTDDAELYTYVSREFTEFPRQVVNDQKLRVASKHRFHPIKDYLENLPAWDGTPRADTLLIDFLGADDNVFTREATVKTLTAAVRRIYEPGCKFDSMLVLAGPPGTGKSTLVAKLAGAYFSDNLTFDDMKDKTAAEKLQGYWILEISEMKGMRKMDVESIKAFVSRQEDIYRAAYGRNTERHKRQCVIFGTVNDVNGYLKDITGNRRFWPVEITGKGTRKPWELSSDERDQIWAEILFRYRELGEKKLILSKEAEALATEKQTEALESDDREGLVEEYLEMLLPKNWGSMSRFERIDFIEEALSEDGEDKGTQERDSVTNIEIWCECFRKSPDSIQSKDSYAIAGILKRLGWEKTGERAYIAGYGRQRVYRRTRSAD